MALVERARRAGVVAPLLLAATGAVTTALLLSRHGVVTTPDGLVYTGTADNLGSGAGLAVPFEPYTDHHPPTEALRLAGSFPLRQWPPLYPATLGALASTGAAPEAVAHVLNPALFGMSLLLVGVLTRRTYSASWTSLYLALVVTILVRACTADAASLPLLHATTLSEPLMLALLLGCLVCVDRAIESGARRDLWAGVALGAAVCTTRFVGASVVAAVAAAGVLVVSPRFRVLRAAACSAVAGLPLVVLLPGTSSGRRAPRVERVTGAARELATGLLDATTPPTWPGVVRGAALVLPVGATAAVAVRAWRRDGDGRRLARILLPGIVGAAMVGHLAVAQVTVDSNIALTGRQLAVPLALVATTGLGIWSSAPTARARRGAAAVAMLVATAAWSGPFAHALRHPAQPADLTGVARLVGSLPDGAPIFTNAPDVVYQASGRPALLVPCPTDYFTHAPRPSYEREVAELRTLMDDGAVVLVIEGFLGRAAECARVVHHLGPSDVRTNRIALFTG